MRFPLHAYLYSCFLSSGDVPTAIAGTGMTLPLALRENTEGYNRPTQETSFARFATMV